jgi:RNA polymerase sigma-70 factor (ECF subfamily)
MFHDDELNGLLSRARSGEEAAIRDLLTRFEQEVMTMVRSRLPRKLRTQFDSTDFVQAVWKSLLVESEHDDRDFDDVEHFRNFLYGMVRNKVGEQHRRLTRTAKYDMGREERLYIRRGDRDVAREVISHDPSPSQAVQASDRMAQLTAGKTEREVEILTLRRQGLTLVEIAERTGVNERSVRRVIDAARLMLESRRWH